MADRWKSLPIVVGGGINLFDDVLTKGTQLTGCATNLQNFEPSIDGGYQRIKGYNKWDSTVVPGGTSNPVLAVKPALDGVFAVRKTAGGDNALYFSSGAGWSAKLNSATRNGVVIKARLLAYSISSPKIVLTDGVNPALIYDGSIDTLVNGTGSPTAPSYAEEWKNKIAYAPGSSASSFILTAPDTDNDCNAANGAIEFNVGFPINGIRKFRDTLYIFGENSISKLTGNTADDYIIEPVTGSIGCIGHDTIQEVGGDLIFLAPDGFRSIAATVRIGDVDLGLLSRNIQTLIRPFTNSADILGFSSCLIRSKAQYRLLIYNPSNSDSDQDGFIGKLNDNSGQVRHNLYDWATIYGIPAYCSESNYLDTEDIVVFGHPTNGYVYRMDQGSSFDGENIQEIYQTPYFYFDEVQSRKIAFKLRIYGRTTGNAAIELNTLLDFQGTGILQPETIVLTISGGSAVWGQFLWGAANWSGSGDITVDCNLIGSGIAIAFRFSHSGTNAPYTIDSFVIEYSTQGRR